MNPGDFRRNLRENILDVVFMHVTWYTKTEFAIIAFLAVKRRMYPEGRITPKSIAQSLKLGASSVRRSLRVLGRARCVVNLGTPTKLDLAPNPHIAQWIRSGEELSGMRRRKRGKTVPPWQR
jgi:hypothetical protein